MKDQPYVLTFPINPEIESFTVDLTDSRFVEKVKVIIPAAFASDELFMKHFLEDFGDHKPPDDISEFVKRCKTVVVIWTADGKIVIQTD